MEPIRAIRGMNDILPDEAARWHLLEETARDLLERYGYREIRTPVVEETRLFQRSIGEATDIVEKEMYTFPDRKGKLCTLRPEGTAGVVRALLEHNLLSDERAPKVYYLGPMFRYERPQKGRYRQFYQIGAEAFGVTEPLIDAEMISMLWRLFERLGLGGLEVRLNSLGDAACRPAYRTRLIAALTPVKDSLCADCQRRFEQNPLRVLDCKNEQCAAIAAGLPSMVELLCDPCAAHFAAVRAALEDLGVRYRLDHRLVRGLDYYTRTTFEVTASSGELGAQNTVAGGGRYDGLVGALGGPETPAIGFAIGLERLLLLTGERAKEMRPRVFIAALGEEARRWAAKAADSLRQRGVAADIEYAAKSLKAQLRRADRQRAALTLIAGEDELQRGVVLLREMAKGTQREIPQGDVAKEVEAALTAAR
jgi:histidyl-tRNA synthetase